MPLVSKRKKRKRRRRKNLCRQKGKRGRNKKEKIQTKHTVRNELLSCLEHERKSEKDRENFIDSEYWQLLQSREKRNVKRTFKVERRRANNRIVNLLQSYRPSYVRTKGHNAGAENVGMFGLQKLMSSPLRIEHSNVGGNSRKKNFKKSRSLVHIKQNSSKSSKKKNVGKNAVLTYLKFEGVSDSEYEEENLSYHSDYEIRPQKYPNNNTKYQNQQHKQQEQQDMGDEDLLQMYSFLQKDSNVIARFKTPPMSELYENAALGDTPNSSICMGSERLFGSRGTDENANRIRYTPSLPYTPEEKIELFEYNSNDMMMMDIGVNNLSYDVDEEDYLMDHNSSLSKHQYENKLSKRKKKKTKYGKTKQSFSSSPIKLVSHNKRNKYLLNQTVPRRRKTNFSRLKQQRKKDKQKTVAEYFSHHHPLKGSVTVGKRLSKFKYKPIVEWNFPQGYKRPWEKPITKNNLRPKPEVVTGHDFEFYGKKLNGQSPLLTIPPKRKPILPLKQHRGNKIEEATIMDRLYNEKFLYEPDHIEEHHQPTSVMLDRIAEANSVITRPEFSKKRGPRRSMLVDDKGAYELSHSVLSDANENRQRIIELQQQIQLARSELEEVERKNAALDIVDAKEEVQLVEEEEEEEKKLANLEKVFKNLH